MSVTADDVLDAIDAALHDWSVSDDAMRWQPEDMQASEPETAGPVLRPGYCDCTETLIGGLALAEWESFPGSGVYYIPAGTYRITGSLPVGTFVGTGSSATVFAFGEAPKAVLPPAPVPGWTVEHWPSVAPAWPPAATVILDDPGQRDAWHAETSARAVLPVTGPGLPGVLAAAGLAGDDRPDLRPVQHGRSRR